MKDHSGCKRGFAQASRAWYSGSALEPGVIDEVVIGFYADGGGTAGGFVVEWSELGGKAAPRLCAYDDGWSALFGFGDLLESMADVDSDDISPNEFCALLVALGIEDMTQEKYPDLSIDVGGAGT